MPSTVQEVGQYKQFANANQVVFTGPGELVGLFISAVSNTPTLTVNDGNATAIATWTPVAATFYPTKLKLLTSANVIVGGNVTVTAIFNT